MEAGDDQMDLDMQLLASVPEADRGNVSSARELLQRIGLIIRSVILFTQGINSSPAAAADHPHDGSSPVSRVSSSKSIENNDEDLEAARTDANMEDGMVVEAQTAPLLNPNDKNTASVSAAESSASTAEAAAAALAISSEQCRTINQPTNETNVTHQLQCSQSQNISKIVREKDFAAFKKFGGLRGVAEALSTDLKEGLSPNEASRRKQKENSLSPIPAPRFFHFLLKALNNVTILLLSLAAVLSLGFGIKKKGLKTGWFDGAIVVGTIVILVLFNSIRGYKQEQRFQKKKSKLSKKNEVSKDVHVVRDRTNCCISNTELVYGDIVLLKKGYQVPADGLFVDGKDLELDHGSESGKIDAKNPFLSYGETVINGDASMVVTSVDMIKATREPVKGFKLEAHINKLNTCVDTAGLIISILILTVLSVRYLIGKMDEENGNRLESKAEPEKMSYFTHCFKEIFLESKYTARALTKLLVVSLVGITQGAPFVISLAIHHWNKRTLSGKATKQDPLAIIKMASVTRICTDKLDDFTEHAMLVENLFIGPEVISQGTTTPPDVLETLCHGIITSTVKELISWAEGKLGLKRGRMEQSWTIFKREGEQPFEERCAVLIGRNIGETEEMYLHWYGPVKEILKMCTQYYNSEGKKAPIDNEAKRFFDDATKKVDLYKRTIAFACKRTDTKTVDEKDLTLVAILGLKDNMREATRKAVEEMRQKYGVETIIISREKVTALKNLALQFGLITADDSDDKVVVKGERLRKFTAEERKEKVNKFRIVEEAFPSDKILFVECLRQEGEVVAFLGQRTDEVPALKQADIAIAMGTWSSKRARENSDIIIFEGGVADFIIMVKSGKWIRANILKFLQLFLIMTIAGTLINFIGAIVLGDGPLTTVQSLWVNLVVVFLWGWPLLTEPLPVSLVSDTGRQSLITPEMTRNIVIQVLYQVSILVILQVKGRGIMGIDQKDVKSMVFNSFILCQFFNQFNARELHEKNFFKGIHRHKWLWVSVAVSVILQGSFVMIQDTLGYGTRMNWKLWAVCFLSGAVSWVIDWLGKCSSEFLITSG